MKRLFLIALTLILMSALRLAAADDSNNTLTDAEKAAALVNRDLKLLSPEKCEHYVNGVKYFEYQLGSEDFNKRVAASKFGKMPKFAKSDIGYLALQGDHGQVSFRNIKIRPIEAKK